MHTHRVACVSYSFGPRVVITQLCHLALPLLPHLSPVLLLLSALLGMHLGTLGLVLNQGWPNAGPGWYDSAIACHGSWFRVCVSQQEWLACVVCHTKKSGIVATRLHLEFCGSACCTNINLYTSHQHQFRQQYMYTISS